MGSLMPTARPTSTNPRGLRQMLRKAPIAGSNFLARMAEITVQYNQLPVFQHSGSSSHLEPLNESKHPGSFSGALSLSQQASTSWSPMKLFRCNPWSNKNPGGPHCHCATGTASNHPRGLLRGWGLTIYSPMYTRDMETVRFFPSLIPHPSSKLTASKACCRVNPLF